MSRRSSDVSVGSIVAAIATTLLIAAVVVASTTYLVRAGRGAEGAGAVAPPQGSQAPGQPAPVLAPDTGRGEAPTAAGVGAALHTALADRRLGSRLAATVTDVASGAVLLDQRGSAPTTPASTAKILTAAATLAAVPADFRFTTKVVAGTQAGEVVIVGGGDPTLSAAGTGRSPVYAGAARIGDLAAAVRRAGVHTVRKVVVDDSRFSGAGLATGWDAGDVAGGYVAPITPLMLDGGRSTLTPGDSPRTAQPDLAAGRALARALGAPGAPVSRGVAPAHARTFGSVRSAPVTEILGEMLSVSDNVLAEAMARQVAVATGGRASFAGSAAAVRRTLAGLGASAAGMQLHDGSGLSRDDAVSPAALTATLRAAASAKRPRLHPLVTALPVAGYAGTLSDRYQTGTAHAGAGLVHAKTGTLTGVSSLAGIAQDTHGRLLAFAFMADGVAAGGTLAAEAVLDVAAARLTACGCR